MEEGEKYEEEQKNPDSHGIFWKCLDHVSVWNVHMGSSLDFCNIEL